MVNTEIFHGNRNRPAALSTKVDAETAARGEQIREHFTAQLRKSTAPSAVAETVIKGIADEQFYIFTDQDWDLDIRRRFEHILARQDPPLGSTAYQESDR
jgi:hypothetical protein